MGGSSSQRSHDVARSFSEKAEKAMPSDDLLAVAASRIPAAGNGLFAAADIPRDSVITHYTGRVLTTKDAMRLPDKTYLMRLGEGVYIDGNPHASAGAASTTSPAASQERIRARTSIASYINDARPYNCYFVKKPKEERADVVALRDIKCGEELYVSYGKMYWSGHKLADHGEKQKRVPVQF